MHIHHQNHGWSWIRKINMWLVKELVGRGSCHFLAANGDISCIQSRHITCIHLRVSLCRRPLWYGLQCSRLPDSLVVVTNLIIWSKLLSVSTSTPKGHSPILLFCLHSSKEYTFTLSRVNCSHLGTIGSGFRQPRWSVLFQPEVPRRRR